MSSDLKNFFELSLTGFFVMQLDEPVYWNDEIDKEKTLEFILSNEKVIKANKAMLDQYGFSESDFLNKTALDFFAHDIEQARKTWRDLLDSGKLHIDTLERKKNGEEMWIEGDYICIYDELGRFKGHIGNQIDVTYRKKLNNDLDISKAKLRGIVNSAMDAIITVNEKQEIEVFNPAAEKMFEYSLNEILGKSLDELIPMPHRINHKLLVEKFGKTGETFRAMSGSLDVYGIRQNGEIFPIEVSISHLEIENSRYFTAIIRDITNRKKTEAEIIKAKVMAEESDKLKSAFLANISHEIRTPLNGIMGFTSLLNDDTLTREERHEYIHILEKSSNRLLNIINDILDYSKIEAGSQEAKISEVNINEKIKEVYNKSLPLCAKNLVELSYTLGLDDSEAYVLTDREKLVSALNKLIDNAFKFTKNGSIEIGYKKKMDYLEFYVKDTGIGIEKDKQEVIFDKFRQGSESLSRDYEGAGLGLTIAKSYAELIGGKIWVKSDVNNGSTFYISIPYKPATIFLPITPIK